MSQPCTTDNTAGSQQTFCIQRNQSTIGNTVRLHLTFHLLRNIPPPGINGIPGIGNLIIRLCPIKKVIYGDYRFTLYPAAFPDSDFRSQMYTKSGILQVLHHLRLTGKGFGLSLRHLYRIGRILTKHTYTPVQKNSGIIPVKLFPVLFLSPSAMVIFQNTRFETIYGKTGIIPYPLADIHLSTRLHFPVTHFKTI